MLKKFSGLLSFIRKRGERLRLMSTWVICEPRFIGSREICELCKNVNLKSKFTGKSREPGSHKLGPHKIVNRVFEFFLGSNFSKVHIFHVNITHVPINDES